MVGDEVYGEFIEPCTCKNFLKQKFKKYVTNTWYSQAVSDQGTNQA
jgi:hypothetical protein